MYLEIVSLAIAVISVVIAAIQTVRIKNLNNIRDTELHRIWKNTKELSGMLFNHSEGEYSRQICGQKSQSIEETTALLIYNLSHWNKKDVEELYKRSGIDEYDKNLLLRITICKEIP